jgi:hypothetical protein
LRAPTVGAFELAILVGAVVIGLTAWIWQEMR